MRNNHWLRWAWIVVLFICLFSSFSMGQEISKSTLYTGEINGRVWKAMEDYNVLWLRGYEEGIAKGIYEATRSNVTKDKFEAELLKVRDKTSIPQNLTIRDVASEIDKFYKESSNVLIPVSSVRDWVIKKMNGATPSELQASLVALRRKANGIQKPPSKPEVKDGKKEQ
jgi:hypothetical protein